MVTAIPLTNEQDDCVLRNVSKVGDQVILGPDRLRPANELTFYTVFGEGTVGGTVVFEGAHDPKFKGQWALLLRQDFANANRVHMFSDTRAHVALRIRVLDAVGGGTVSVYGIAN